MLKCFVACAFGRDDVDRIYTRGVIRAARATQCELLRVDRVEHNDDIDDKIAELMASADLCIADLTYARPSVYYEAGVMHGAKKPVIYTVRSDHLRPRADDPEGNRRIHFDLQMRNIVKWRDADDREFRTRLQKRLGLVIAPILNQRKRDIELAAEQSSFGAEPIAIRSRQVTNAAKHALKKFGYTLVFPTTGEVNPADRILAAQCGRQNVWLRTLCRETITVREMRLFGDYLGTRDLEVYPDASRFGEPESADIHCVLISMTPVPKSRIRLALPHFREELQIDVPSYSRSGTFAKKCTVHVISPVRHLGGFKDQFRLLLKAIEDGGSRV